MVANPSRPLTRRERERLARRQLILDAALKVFAYRGFTDTKLDDVAELAEFGKTTLYSYFPTKEALFESVVEDAFMKFKAIAEEAFATDEPFERQLERFIRGELEHFHLSPWSLHLLMSESHHLRGANPMIRMMPGLLAVLTTAIEREQRERRMMPGADSIDLALMLMNMLFGQCMARVYRRLCDKGMENVLKDATGLEEFLGDLRKGDLEQEIARASALIHAVYLHGTTERSHEH